METGEVDYDLTTKLAPFLDPHLLLPLLHQPYLRKVYDSKSLARQKIHLLKKTRLFDYAIEIMESIGDEVTPEFLQKKEEAIKTASDVHQSVIPLLETLENQETFEKIKQISSTEELFTNFTFDRDILQQLFKWAVTIFDGGQYELAHNLLAQYRDIVLCSRGEAARAKIVNELTNSGKDVNNYISATWGLLACCILELKWVLAADIANQLNDFIAAAYEASESRMVVNNYGKPEQRLIETCKNDALIQRAWLLHWSLFILFKVNWEEKKKDDTTPSQAPSILLESFLNEKTMSVIVLTAPHMMRYVAALCILHNKKLKHLMRDIVTVIHSESELIRDPITDFLVALLVNMDFDEAQVQLQKCLRVCEMDYFLEEHQQTFVDNARHLIFEAYCRVHQSIDITMIAEKLSMLPDVAEEWIVNLIQIAQLDARIDTDNNCVLMEKEAPSVYETINNKTQSMFLRTSLLQTKAASVAALTEKKASRSYNQ